MSNQLVIDCVVDHVIGLWTQRLGYVIFVVIIAYVRLCAYLLLADSWSSDVCGKFVPAAAAQPHDATVYSAGVDSWSVETK